MSNKSTKSKIVLKKTIQIFQPGVTPLGKGDWVHCYGKLLDLMEALENALLTEEGEVLMWSVEITGKGFKLQVGLCVHHPPSSIQIVSPGYTGAPADEQQQFTCDKEHDSLSIVKKGPGFVYKRGKDCFEDCGPVVEKITSVLAREEETAGVP